MVRSLHPVIRAILWGPNLWVPRIVSLPLTWSFLMREDSSS